jgi:hypothetical protein
MSPAGSAFLREIVELSSHAQKKAGFAPAEVSESLQRALLGFLGKL